MSLHQNICSRNQPCPVLDSPNLMWGGSCGIGRVARDPECSTAPSPAPQTPLSHPDSPECHCPHLQPGKGLCSPGALTQRVQGQGEMWGSARLGAQPPLGHSRVQALSFPSSVCSGRHRWSWMVGGAVAPLLGFLSAAFSSNSSPQAGAAVPLSGSAVQPWHPRVNQVVQEQNQRCRIRGTSISQPGRSPSLQYQGQIHQGCVNKKATGQGGISSLICWSWEPSSSLIILSPPGHAGQPGSFPWALA